MEESLQISFGVKKNEVQPDTRPTPMRRLLFSNKGQTS